MLGTSPNQRSVWRILIGTQDLTFCVIRVFNERRGRERERQEKRGRERQEKRGRNLGEKERKLGRKENDEIG